MPPVHLRDDPGEPLRTRATDKLPAGWPWPGWRMVGWREACLALVGYVVHEVRETADGCGLEVVFVDTVRPDLVVAVVAGVHVAMRQD